MYCHDYRMCSKCTDNTGGSLSFQPLFNSYSLKNKQTVNRHSDIIPALMAKTVICETAHCIGWEVRARVWVSEMYSF